MKTLEFRLVVKVSNDFQSFKDLEGNIRAALVDVCQSEIFGPGPDRMESIELVKVDGDTRF